MNLFIMLSIWFIPVAIILLIDDYFDFKEIGDKIVAFLIILLLFFIWPIATFFISNMELKKKYNNGRINYSQYKVKRILLLLFIVTWMAFLMRASYIDHINEYEPLPCTQEQYRIDNIQFDNAEQMDKQEYIRDNFIFQEY